MMAITWTTTLVSKDIFQDVKSTINNRQMSVLNVMKDSSYTTMVEFNIVSRITLVWTAVMWLWEIISLPNVLLVIHLSKDLLSKKMLKMTNSFTLLMDRLIRLFNQSLTVLQPMQFQIVRLIHRSLIIVDYLLVWNVRLISTWLMLKMDTIVPKDKIDKMNVPLMSTIWMNVLNVSMITS